MITRSLTLALFLTFMLAVSAAQQGQSPLPPLPSDVPQNALMRMILTDKTPSGQDAVWTTPDGVLHEFYQFNDRGRGPKTYATFRVDSKGIITSEEIKGVDYMKSPVDESFTQEHGAARWKNSSEDEKAVNAAGKFYVDLNGGPESSALMIRALLRSKTGTLPLLPAGEARIRKLQSLDLNSAGRKLKVTLCSIEGLDYTPNYVWI